MGERRPGGEGEASRRRGSEGTAAKAASARGRACDVAAHVHRAEPLCGLHLADEHLEDLGRGELRDDHRVLLGLEAFFEDGHAVAARVLRGGRPTRSDAPSSVGGKATRGAAGRASDPARAACVGRGISRMPITLCHEPGANWKMMRPLSDASSTRLEQMAKSRWSSSWTAALMNLRLLPCWKKKGWYLYTEIKHCFVI